MNLPYRTRPGDSTKLPPGIPYIIGNEAAERFSYYGMKTILVVFMTQYLQFNDESAKAYNHYFVAAAYFFPVIGAMISDWLFGKYRTILALSIVYCLGHLVLALDETESGLAAGLCLIAVGAGGIKPCVSAHVGDQFGRGNKHLLSRVFGWFYFSINVGAFASSLLTPILLRRYGPSVAFGVPGVLMALATFVFWLGRHRFIHVPPTGFKSFRTSLGGEDARNLLRLIPLFLCISLFWSVFDQTGSAWVLQAMYMDRHLVIDWLPDQIQALNPILVLCYIPIFTYVIYPRLGKVTATPLRKMTIGMFVMVIACAIPAIIETNLQGGRISQFRLNANQPMQSISHADPAVHHATELIDGDTEQGAWISAGLERDPDSVEPLAVITIELRERRAWKTRAFRLHFAQDIQAFLEDARSAWDSEHPGEVAEPDWFTVKGCRPREVSFHHAQSRVGPWTPATEGGTDPLPDSSGLEGSTGPADDVRFIQIRIHENGGGKYVAASEVEILTDGDDGNVAAIGYRPSILWQILAYLVLTAAEIMVSITCLEFAYTQAPRSMKSLIMSLYLLTVSLGNLITGLVNSFIQTDDGGSLLPGASYFWFFTGLMFLGALLLGLVARNYQGKTYIDSD